ncbi:MAG: VWA domain-containing protein, partial [Brevundimonas sp.]
HLEFFYFHNCLYEGVWKDNRRRHNERIPTWDLLHRYNGDWRAIFVGDATMSPYEITMPGGSVEHWNEEAGAVWMDRAVKQWPRSVWLNPVAERYWSYTASVGLIRDQVESRMYPLTLEGLDRAMRRLGA